MADEEDRVPLTVAVNARDEILLAIGWPRDDCVLVGEACIAETRRHGFGSGRDVADGVRRIDLNELFENLMRERTHNGAIPGTDGRRKGQNQRQKDKAKSSLMHS
jgi:hypothetical protein